MRFKVVVNGKWQGGSFSSREKADAVAASLRKPGVVVEVEVKASAPPVPPSRPLDDEEMRRAFEELRDERDAAVRRAAEAEAALADAAKSETKPGKQHPPRNP